MRRLAGTSLTNDILLNVWIRDLSKRLKNVLVAMDSIDLDKLAEIAMAWPRLRTMCQINHNFGSLSIYEIL